MGPLLLLFALVTCPHDGLAEEALAFQVEQDTFDVNTRSRSRELSGTSWRVRSRYISTPRRRFDPWQNWQNLDPRRRYVDSNPRRRYIDATRRRPAVEKAPIAVAVPGLGTLHIPIDELEDLGSRIPLVKETKPELVIPLQGGFFKFDSERLPKHIFAETIPKPGDFIDPNEADLIVMPVMLPGSRGLISVKLQKSDIHLPKSDMGHLSPKADVRDEAMQWKAPGSPGNPDLPGEEQESETQLPETTWHNAARWEQKSSGKCQIEGACLSSPHFPKPYGPREGCEVSLPPFSVIRIVNFTTESKYDYLTINGYKYSGSGESVVGATGVLWSNISWQSYRGASHGGWRICVEKPPSCSDGLELVPVAIPDCPPSGEDLPNCNDAAPGELCEGDGRCGTRKDINNCYDQFHTYPATRDVYQKANTRTSTAAMTTATRTTRTATTMTKTSTTSTTTPLAFRSAGEQWIVGGPCRVDDRCLRSPRYLGYGRLYGPNQSCVASLPPFSVITIRFFSTRKYFDSLTVNGYKYSGSGLQGTSTVLWSNISWTSSGWNNLKPGMPLLPRMRGWRICVEKPPSCSDGLELVPVAISDCPPSGDDLPNCNDAAPGELCEGDGRCGTREDLNNCYDKFHTYPATRDVYQKETGSTRTSTTSTTTMTMTVPLESIVIDWSIEIVFWVIAGAFAVAFLLFCIIRLSRDKSSVPSVQEAGSAAPVA